MPDPVFEFDVALSFAGTEREYASAMYHIGTANGLKIYYDEYDEAELWGKNLVEYLSDVYENRARYCLIIVSKDYCERAYTTVERRAALDRAIKSRGEYILPVVTDDAWPPGLPHATAQLDLRKMKVEQVMEILLRKLRGSAAEKLVVPADVELQKVSEVPAVDLKPDPGMRFAVIRLADEVKYWRETQFAGPFDGCVQNFDGELSGDPVFDITLMNRATSPQLLTAVGMEFLELKWKMEIMGGGFEAPEITRSRTFYLELPDLWMWLASNPQGGALQQIASSRIPDPVWLDTNKAYRYALALPNYQNLIPNRAAVHFWIRTDQGEFRSPKIYIGYLVPGEYGGLARMHKMMRGETLSSAVAKEAHDSWVRAGSPAGRDKDFWYRAEQMVERWWGVRKRPL